MKKQIELSYSFDAFEPIIDTLTMETHYGKHHKTYTDNLNAIIDSTPELQNHCVKTSLRNLDQVPEAVRAGFVNNAGGYLNHNLYFDTISPNPVKSPSGSLADKINTTFGSLENLKIQLTDAAVKQFGSGWAWLAVNDETGELKVLQTANQDTVYPLGYTPILGVDVWEHAYYLNYQNRRPDYIKEFFRVVNWDFVNERLEKGLKSSGCQR